MRLNKKIVLVTAAASGMGRAGVTRFAHEGAQVAAVDIDEKTLTPSLKVSQPPDSMRLEFVPI